MGWDRYELLWNDMGWGRKICPMDKPGEQYIKWKKSPELVFTSNFETTTPFSVLLCIHYNNKFH